MRGDLLLLLKFLNKSHIEIKIYDLSKNRVYFSGTTWGLFDWINRAITNDVEKRYAVFDIMLSKEVNCCYIKNDVLIVYLDD